MVGRRELIERRPDLEDCFEAADSSFPVRVTRSFFERMNAEDPRDPLALQVMPDPRELEPDPEGLEDPVGDAHCSPVPWVVHKYPTRVLLLLTKRCHLYCRYCFRRTHKPGDTLDPTSEELSAALEYIRQARPREVILSGGDPLACRDEQVFGVMDELVGPTIRVHTRAPITAPERVTPALVEGLSSRRAWVIVHCNHPDELSSDVDEALARFVDGGVPVLNQAVLLRGVNDDPDTLVELCEQLTRRRVFPYYLHHTDRVRGNRHFRVSAAEGLALYGALQRRLSGLSLPRYVIDPPQGTGKVDVSDAFDAGIVK